MKRKVLLTLGTMVFLLSTLFVLNRINQQREVASQRATGLAAAEEPSPILAMFTRSGVPEQPNFGFEQIAAQRSGVAAKQIIRVVELTLIVGNVDESATKLRRLAEERQGEIDEVRIWNSTDSVKEGLLQVRVPASDLDASLVGFKRVAVRVTKELIGATDVSRRYADNEATMRNLKAEEQQYFAIMRQARTVPDTLQVAEKLSDVRRRIETLQTQINTMLRDVAMSQVTISLRQDGAEDASPFSWRPVRNARNALRSLASGLTVWVDAMITAIIVLPVILLWIVSIGGAGFGAAKAGMWVWRRRPR